MPWVKNAMRAFVEPNWHETQNMKQQNTYTIRVKQKIVLLHERKIASGMVRGLPTKCNKQTNAEQQNAKKSTRKQCTK